MTEITLEQYAGPYLDHPDFTPERQVNAKLLLIAVNECRRRAAADGVQLEDNPHTGCGVSGDGHGGFRDQACPIGAPGSTHKQGNGVDNYDLNQQYARWCYAHPEILRAVGLTMENHQWTPSWCHQQRIPPGPPGSPWRLDYVPNNTPPLCKALAEQAGKAA